MPIPDQWEGSSEGIRLLSTFDDDDDDDEMALPMTEALPLGFRKNSLTDDEGFVSASGNDVQTGDSKGFESGERKGYPSSISEESDDPDHRGATFEKNTALVEFYKPIPEYEGAHRYDPHFHWTAKEESNLVKKIDLRIMVWCCFTFFALQLDRGNVVQAVSDKLLDDLNMTTNDYNNGQLIFYFCFLFAELPSQAIGKRIGPDNWIPCQMILWSVVAACQSLLTSKSNYYACRALLGLFEGGYIPDTVLYLSYFYTSKELPKRLSFFWTVYEFTAIISAFMALGLLRISTNGLEGWRWLFAIEGLLTGSIGIASYFYLPPSPCQTASKIRGKGWFSEKEEKIMVNRVLRDDPSKGTMHNRQALAFPLLWKALKDRDMWPIYLIGLSWNIPAQPVSSYLTLILESLGFSTFHTNLLTIPAYCIFIINLLSVTFISERINERLLLSLFAQFWAIPILIALEALGTPETSGAKWGRYVLSILLVGQPYVHAIYVALTSRNAGSVRTRAVASAIYNITVQMSNVIGSEIYRTNDKPLYHKGNAGLLAICVWNIIIIVFAKWYYVNKNRSRAKIWDGMSTEEKHHYLATTTDEGNRRLDFRFAH